MMLNCEPPIMPMIVEMMYKTAITMPHLTQAAAFWGALQAPTPLMPAMN